MIIELSNARITKAENLLTHWAFRILSGRKNIEKDFAVYTGTCPMYQGAIAVNLYKSSAGISYQMNEKQTRSKDRSMMPPGVGRVRTLDEQCILIEELMTESFRPKAKEMAFILFLPRSIFGESVKDKQLAILSKYNPKRASEIKVKAISLVATKLLGPVEDNQSERKI